MSTFVAVVFFPGNNCELETQRALKRQGLDARLIRWNQPDLLEGAKAVVIPGGFSFEDRGRSGVIAAQEPIMERVKDLANEGVPILGICNGAQILVESGLIASDENGKTCISLARNERRDNTGCLLGTGFYHAHTYCKPVRKTPFSNFSQLIYIPLAHGEGRFMIPESLKETMKANIVFTYTDENGVADNHFPFNPNGSFENAAALSNTSGNVVAMMPHPERTPNGDGVFASLKAFLDGVEGGIVPSKEKYTVESNISSISDLNNDIEFFVSLKITDNVQKTFERVLQEKGEINPELKRSIRWGMSFGDTPDMQAKQDRAKAIIKSFELLNPHKESVQVKIEEKVYQFFNDEFVEIEAVNEYSICVQDDLDVKGESKKRHFNHLFPSFAISSLTYMEKWSTKKESHLSDLSLFANPVSQRIYR